MKSLEYREQSLDLFEAHKDHRLKGGELSNAMGGGYNLMVSYRHNSIPFDTVVARVGRTVTGAQLLTLSVREPDSGKDFYLTLKARKGVVSWRSLKGSRLEEFGDMPEEAVLVEDEEIDPDTEANFTTKDEKQFQKLHAHHEMRMTPLSGGSFHVSPQNPHRPGSNT